MAFAELLVTDIRSGRLPISHAAHLHLLDFYIKARHFEAAYHFWSWLVQQDDTHVGFKLYACAIHLFALQGRPAEETEVLYSQALKRFPTGFPDYHFSPSGVVADRGQASDLSGLPMRLLQAVIAARLMRGETKTAYLGLDTALRLSPAKLSRVFFDDFIKARPVTEAYRVFHLAYRSGCDLYAETAKQLVIKLRHAVKLDPLTNLGYLRAALTVVYMQTRDGAPSQSLLTEVVIAILSVMDTPVLARLPQKELHDITERFLSVTLRVLSTFNASGIQPKVTTYNVMISNLAGLGKRADLLVTFLNDMQQLSIKPTTVTHRSILIAAGRVQDKEMLVLAWRTLVDAREAEGSPPDQGDWKLLGTACARCGCGEVVYAELARLAHAVTSHVSSIALRALQGDEHMESVETKRRAPPGLDAAAVIRIIDTLEADALVLEQAMSDGSALSTPDVTVPDNLDCNLVRASDDDKSATDVQICYDDLTTINSFDSAPETEPASIPSAVSPTGVPYDVLRFEHWRAVNELLAQSEMYNDAYDNAVEKALASHVAPPAHADVWETVRKTWFVGHTFGLSGSAKGTDDALRVPAKGSNATVSEEKDWRIPTRNPADIASLRGLSSP